MKSNLVIWLFWGMDRQFVEGVKRLRIARKDEAFVVIHQN